MKLQVKKGTTSKPIDIFIQDSSSTTGAGLTGLVYNSAGLSAYYYREGAASATAITLATMTLGTWATGGFVVIDGTNMPGCYQLGIPDAALATGANSVVVMLKGATNMAPVVLEIQLVDYDPQDATALGLSRLDAAITSRLAASSAPANFSALSITAGGLVDITQAAADKVWSSATRTLSSFGTLVADIWGNSTRTLTAFSTSLAASVWDVLETAILTASSIGLKVKNNLDTAITTRHAAGAAVASVTGAVGSVTAAVTVGTNNDKTGYAIGVGGIASTAFAAGAVDAASLSADASNEVADAVLNRNVAGGSSTGRLVKEALYLLRNKAAIAAGTLTVYGTDDVTSAWTAVVTTTAGNPVSTIDPV